jgi:hypothetical protein
MRHRGEHLRLRQSSLDKGIYFTTSKAQTTRKSLEITLPTKHDFQKLGFQSLLGYGHHARAETWLMAI